MGVLEFWSLDSFAVVVLVLAWVGHFFLKSTLIACELSGSKRPASPHLRVATSPTEGVPRLTEKPR